MLIAYLLMYAISVLKQLRIPIHVKHIEKLQDTVVVDPKHSVVEFSGAVRVVVKKPLQLRSPVSYVEL